MNTEAGWHIIANDTKWRAWVTGANLPCCTLVASWLLEVDGQHIENPTDWKQYYMFNPEWWNEANVVNPAQPWSALTAAQELLGGTLQYVEKVSSDAHAPQLTPGHWHVIQRWKYLDVGDDGIEDDVFVNGAKGHTYLAYASETGTVTIVQSSVAKGFRVNDGTWEGTAGLDGWSVGVVTLPKDT